MTEPITLEEAKNYLKVDGGEDNVLISGLISTARELAEIEADQVFIIRTIELVYDDAPESIEIPYRPLYEVTKIETISEADVKTEVSSSLYNVDTSGKIFSGRIKLKSGCTWPTHRDFASFIITIKAGYGTAEEDVPSLIKQAILQIIGHLYENRGSQVIPAGAIKILEKFKIHLI